MELSNTQTTTLSSPAIPQNEQEAAAVEKANTVNAADIVTIDEARQRLGPNAPTRDAFHKAVNRGQLKKLPQQEGDKTFRFLWSDILEWRARGATKKRGSSKKRRNKGSSSGKEADPSAPISNAESAHALPPSITPEIGSGVISAISQITAGGESAPSEPLPALEQADEDYLAAREAVVDSGIKASIAASRALHEIKTYRDGLLWKKNFRSFAQYLSERWGYQKSYGYHLVDVGDFVAKLVCSDSAIAESLPVNEGQLRPMFKVVPKEHRVACWAEITADKHPSELTGPMVGAGAKKFAKNIGLQLKHPRVDEFAKSPKPTPAELAKRELENLRSALEKLAQSERFNQLLLELGILIDQDPDEGVIEVTATEVESAPEAQAAEDIRQSA